MRALFKEAAAAAPCLIFVDELDALGKQRALRLSGSNDEVEQTLNQMLACMDGVDTSNNGVIVMGATNRYEILDPALTRPGRFDRLVRINLPDEAGRLDILQVHTRKLTLGPNVDLQAVAEATPLYSGAELAALSNEAAIRAVSWPRLLHPPCLLLLLPPTPTSPLCLVSFGTSSCAVASHAGRYAARPMPSSRQISTTPSQRSQPRVASCRRWSH